MLPPSDAKPLDRASFERRMSLVFVGSFITLGLFSPFFPVWLASKGLNGDQIGLILAVQIGLRVVACPLVLRLADRSPDRALVLLAIAFASALVVNIYHLTDTPIAILIATLLLAAAWSPVIPLSDAVAPSGVRRLEADYGRSRLWGSLAFIVANVVGGFVIAQAGEGWFPTLLSVSFLAAAVVTLAVPRLGRPRRASAPPLAPTTEPWLPIKAPRFDVRRLAPQRDVRGILSTLLAIALIQSSHALFNGFGSLLWTGLGYTSTQIGVLWAIGVVAEVVLFRFAARPMRRLGVRGFLLVAGGTCVLRWALFSLDIGFWGFAVLQTSHAITFAATHIALQTVIASSVQEDRYGAAQGTAFAIQTTLMAATTFLGGVAFAAMGAQSFLWMSAVSAVALLVLLLRRQPQSRDDGGATVEPS